MKKILLSTVIIFGYVFGYSQSRIVGLDTISDPHIYYFMNNLNNLIAQDDSSVNEFKDMFSKECDITFRVMDVDIYYNTVKKRYSGSYDILLINEKLGITDKIAVLFGINSPTTFQARTITYWFDHYNNFHPIIVEELDGSTTDKSDYSTLK